MFGNRLGINKFSIKDFIKKAQLMALADRKINKSYPGKYFSFISSKSEMSKVR